VLGARGITATDPYRPFDKLRAGSRRLYHARSPKPTRGGQARSRRRLHRGEPSLATDRSSLVSYAPASPHGLSQRRHGGQGVPKQSSLFHHALTSTPADAPPEVYLPMEGGQVRISCLLRMPLSETREPQKFWAGPTGQWLATGLTRSLTFLYRFGTVAKEYPIRMG
jgi:hypothetical protein